MHHHHHHLHHGRNPNLVILHLGNFGPLVISCTPHFGLNNFLDDNHRDARANDDDDDAYVSDVDADMDDNHQ